jgi:hypothetical protein
MKDAVRMIEEFRHATDLQKIEQLADNLADGGERRAIGPLLYRLGDFQVQADPDVEDAVCGALVKFGVMLRLGNLNFRFEHDSKLDVQVRKMFEEYRVWIPRKYFRK